MCVYIYIYIYIYIYSFIYIYNNTQYCKSTIPQLKKNPFSKCWDCQPLGKIWWACSELSFRKFLFSKKLFFKWHKPKGLHDPQNHGTQAFRSLNHTLYFCAISLCTKMPIIREPQDSVLTAHPESTAWWFPWVCEPLWGWCNATTQVVLRKRLLAECTFEACISGQGGTFSSPCWDPAKAKWQLFLERSLTDSLWQWLLILHFVQISSSHFRKLSISQPDIP